MEGGNDDGTLLCYRAPNGILDVVLEDDGAVGYAYLRHAGDVCADVWLYNVEAAPAAPDWETSAQPPFRNPAHLALENGLGRITNGSAIDCVWSDEGVRISVDGVQWAELRVGEKPGRSRLARLDGPLAKVLESP